MKDIIYIIKPKLIDGYLTFRDVLDDRIWKTFPSIKEVYRYSEKWGFSVVHLNTTGGD